MPTLLAILLTQLILDYLAQLTLRKEGKLAKRKAILMLDMHMLSLSILTARIKFYNIALPEDFMLMAKKLEFTKPELNQKDCF